MLASRTRNDAYYAALRHSVPAGGVVLDVGTGAGVLAILACHAGAARVYAVEPAPIIHLAQTIAAASRVADRITFIERSSFDVRLPEPVDVIVADIRGTLPLIDDAVAALIDVRDRFLRPGGVMIPRADRLRGAIVCAPVTYADTVGAWVGSRYGIDCSPGRLAACSQVTTLGDHADEVISTHGAWFTLDYQHQATPSADGRLDLTVTRDACGHGCALWFDADLGNGTGYTTAPGTGDQLYGRAFLPWPEPVELRAGWHVSVDLRASFVDGGYVWNWRTAFGPEANGLVFRQSSFAAVPLSRERLRRRLPTHRPTLGVEAKVDALALDLLSSGLTLGEAAARINEHFPERVAGEERLLARLADLAERYEGR
jgi:protein arginine N-methyltransferase 1